MHHAPPFDLSTPFWPLLSLSPLVNSPPLPAWRWPRLRRIGPGRAAHDPRREGGGLMTAHAARHTALPPPTAPSTRAPARRRQAAGCRLLRRTRRLAHVAANSMLSACGLTAAGARAAQVPREPSGWRRSEKTGQGWRLAAQAAPHLVQRLVCGHRADSLPPCDRRYARHSQHHVAAGSVRSKRCLAVPQKTLPLWCSRMMRHASLFSCTEPGRYCLAATRRRKGGVLSDPLQQPSTTSYIQRMCSTETSIAPSENYIRNTIERLSMGFN